MLAQKKNDYQRDLFKTNLEGMLNHNEPLFRLAQKIDWEKFDTEFGKLYCPDNGRPAKLTRLMVGLHYLVKLEKGTILRKCHNPYFLF